MQSLIIRLPIAIEYYNDISESEHNMCVEFNRKWLKEKGYVERASLNSGSDSHVELFALPEVEFNFIDHVSYIEVFDCNGVDIEVGEIENIWQGLE